MMWVRQTSRRQMTRMAIAAALAAMPVLIDTGGCQAGPATTQPTSISDRQDAALRDPMNYKPPTIPTVGDGDITSFDSAGLKRDLNDFFNP